MPCAQDLTLEQKAAALRKAHPAYAAAEVEAALLAHGGDVNATAAALVLGADARAEVWGHAVHLAAVHHRKSCRGAVSSCRSLPGVCAGLLRCVWVRVCPEGGCPRHAGGAVEVRTK